MVEVRVGVFNILEEAEKEFMVYFIIENLAWSNLILNIDIIAVVICQYDEVRYS